MIITQSLAIFDFLERTFPTPSLSPAISSPSERSLALSLAFLVVCEIQPPQNSRIHAKIAHDFRGDGEAWARTTETCRFYERLVVRAGK